MDIINLLAGVVIGGVGGYLAKDKLSGTNQQLAEKQRETDSLFKENEKLYKRNKELERQVEDLLFDLKRVRQQNKQNDEDQDDLEDELSRVKRELANLRSQNLELTRKAKEYQSAYNSLEAELSMYKQKNN